MTPEDARRIVDAWRPLKSSMARTFCAIVDAMPEDDPDNYAAAVAALVRGLPAQWADTVELVNVTAHAFGGLTLPTVETFDAGPTLDPLDLLRGDDADR